MFFRIGAVCWVSCVLVLGVASAALAQPVPIGIGDTIQGEIPEIGDVREYAFSAPAGQVVFLDSIASSNTAGLNWRLDDRWGRTLLSNTTSFGDLGPVTLIGGDDYRITVLGEGLGTGTFEFALIGVTNETGSFAIDATVTGQITAPGQRFDYSFVGAPGQRIYLDVIATSNAAGLNWILSDSLGRELLPRTGSLADVGPFTLVGGGYGLTILGEGAAVGTYEFRVANVVDDAVSVAIGDTVSGTLVIGQVDTFTFSATAGQRLFLDVVTTSNSAGLNWILADDQGRELLARTGSLVDVGPFALAGGDYVLTILGEGASVGTYEFRPVAVTDGGSAIAVGDTVTGGITDPGERDDYTFSAAAGQMVYLDVVTTSNSAGLDWILRDSYGRDILAQTTSLADQGPFTLQAGMHTLSVVGEAGAVGTYEFRLVGLVDGGGPIAIGDTVSSALAEPGEKDVYVFTASPNQVISLDQLATSNVNALNWILVDALGREVLSRTVNLLDQGPFTLVGGSYTLTVIGEGAAVGTYDFQLVDLGTGSFVPSGVAANVGDTISGAIDVVGEVDSYRFTVGAGQRVYLDLLVGGLNLNWTLLDPVGQPVFGLTRARFTDSEDRGPFTLTAGDYTLRLQDIASGVPPYQFRIVDVTDSATVISLGDVVAGAFSIPGSRHTFEFSVARGQSIYLDLQTGDANLFWSLRETAGPTIFGLVRALTTTTEDRGPFTLTAGSYTLTLDPQFHFVPAYQFQLVGVANDVTPIAIGDLVTDTFTLAGSTKTYSFTTAADQRVYLDLQAGDANLFWSLFDPVGQPVFSSLRASSPTSEDRGPFTLGAGTHDLVLDPTTSALPSFAFQTFDVADQLATLNVGDVVSGAFADPGAVHRFTFSLGAPTRLYFDNQLAVANLFWTLRDPVGEIVSLFAGVQMNNLTGSDRGPFTLAAGTYELALNATGGAQPAYQFRVVEVTDLLATLTIDTPVTGTISGPGGTAAFTFTAFEGQRLLFDSIGNAAGLRWTLLNDQGNSNGLFTAVVASTDQGPIDLGAGTYTLVLDADSDTVPSFNFVVRNVAADLVPAVVSAAPMVFRTGETGRALDLTWTVDNDGGGPAITSPWTDRIVVSPDAVVNDGDDILLGEFTNTPPLAPRASYTRVETLVLPDSLPLGEHYVYVICDVNGQIDEIGGETNNTRNVRIAVVPGTAAPIGCITFDQASGASFPAGSVIALSGRAAGLSGTVNVLYTIDVSLSTQAIVGLDCNFNGTLDAGDDLNGDGVGPVAGGGGSILDCEIGASLVLDQYVAQNGTSVHAGVVFSATAAALDVAPAPFQQRWNAPFDRDDNSNGVGDFEEVLRSLYSVGGPFCVSGTGASLFTSVNTGCATNYRDAILASDDVLSLIGAADQQLLVYLTDGDAEPDTNVPSDSELAQLASRGIQFQGFQIGAGQVTPDLQRLADQIAAHPNSSGSARSVLDVNDLLFEIVQSVAIIGITVNGVQADSVDAAGRFFHLVTIQPGQNCFDVTAFDASGGQCTGTICLEGVDLQGIDIEQLMDVTTSLDVDYSNTTFNHALSTFVTHARAQNLAETPLDGPVLMVIENITQPSVTVANPDGYTEDGKPFFEFVDQSVNPVLEPLELSPRRPLIFDNPEQVPVSFDVSWLALGNHPPFFTTAPSTQVVAGQMFSYSASATDPDGHALEFHLDTAPLGMSVGLTTGLVSWVPTVADVGLHSVALVARDSRGGRSVQSFALEVVLSGSNRPPVFTSAPSTHVAIGTTYQYTATASDPDGNPLLFTKQSGPVDLVVDPNGFTHWAFTLPGNYTVTVRASDGNGGTADQTYVLSVGSQPTNPHAPMLFGTPSVIATAGNLYLYQPAANDLDALDVLEFTLTTAPTGMGIEAASGRVTWIPSDGQVGSHSVVLVVDDGNGASTTQSWTIEVFDEPQNQPPVITSVPGFVAVVGQTYEYPVSAIDPEGLAVEFSLVSPPVGMTIDPQTGLLSWTPTQPETATVAIRALDPALAFGSQVFTLTASPPNTLPTFDSTPVLTATVGGTYRYDVNALDGDGHALTFLLAAGPAGMQINPLTGLITWVPTAAQIGPNPVTVVVDDGHFGNVPQTFTVTVAPDVTPPTVQILFTQVPAAVGTPLQICVQASDNVGILARTATVDGVKVPLEVNGCGFYTPPMTPGMVMVVVTAIDPSGNEAQATEMLTIVDPTDPDAPVVSIISPAPDAMITAPTAIVANISDNSPATLSWEVRIARLGTDTFRTIAAGTGEVAAGVIATFDPTLLPNDNYRVQIVGSDGVQTGGIEFQYAVAGGYKMGNFSYEFTDLVFQLAGIPLVVTRQYNTLDLSPGEFGVGWRLGLPGRVTDTVDELMTGQSFVDLLGTPPYQYGTRVYVTRPDGQRVGFTFEPTPLPFPQAFQWVPRFRPDPGVSDTLEAETASGIATLWNFGTGFLEYVIPYNPRRFEFTTALGVKYTIDEFDGLERIDDVYGNSIVVTPDGLVSSTGVALDFDRDASGRITTITEPKQPGAMTPPGQLHYDYDASGNLIRFTDRGGGESEYFYEEPAFPNYMTRLEDPLGRNVLRNVYDNDGRLIAQCGVDGDPVTLIDCIVIDNDVVAGVQTVITARGLRVDHFVDAEGRVVKRRRYLEDGINFVDEDKTYDANGHLLTFSVGGITLTRTYDARGNVLTETEADGQTWTYTYVQPCNLVASETDPAGNVTTFEYDAQCNLRFITNPLGGVTELRYDRRGDVTDYFDPEGNRWQFTYDQYGHPATTTDPLGNTMIMQHNMVGDLLWQIDRMGRRVDFEYDAAHRLVREVWDTVPPREILTTYNAAGYLTSAVDPDSATTVDYWETGDVKSVDNSGTPNVPHVVVTYGYLSGGVVMRGYDASGNVTNVMDSLGGMTEYEYDETERLRSVAQYPAPEVVSSATPPNEKLLDVAYNPQQFLARVSRYADLTRTTPVAYTDFEYDCVGCVKRLSAIRHRRASDDSVIHDLEYARDAVTNVSGILDAEGAHSYAYDGGWRLLAATHPVGGIQPDESYSYDEVGNRTTSHLSMAYSYSRDLGLGGNQLRQDDDYDYVYDANGQLARQTDRVTGSYLTFAYDHRVRLTDIATFDALDTELGRTTFTYDVLNRRIRVDADGQVSTFVYDDINPILKLTPSGDIISRRLYGLVNDDILADQVGATTRWFLNDETGTVRDLVTDAASTIAHFVYDTFGQLLGVTPAVTDNDLAFTAREALTDLPFLYYRGRVYDPRLGRFSQEDPYAPFQYEYVDNNPLGFSDAVGYGPLIEYRPIIAGGINWLYVGCEAGKVVYVGITGNPGARALAHQAAGRTFKFCKIMGNLSRPDARALEQALIDGHGGPGRGAPGRLLNKIRSVALGKPLANRAAGFLSKLGGPAAVAQLGLCLLCLP
ncbi:MAG: putative Ig domain-containing protein [Planctomycetota bacterium]